MKKSIIILIIIVVILLVMFKPFNKEKDVEQTEEITTLNSLEELFPSEKIEITYEEGEREYKVEVVEIDKKEDKTTIIMEREIEDIEGKVKVQTIYEITEEKIVESGKHIKDGKVVSTIYPVEILIGMPYEGLSWKSKDEKTTYKVTSMREGKVTIESTRKIDVYEEGNSKPIQKEYKETRVFEKGKGMVLYRTEIVGEEDSIYEIKQK